ncbi:MAG TPA: alpha-hydroxy acid oxidase [Stellaceae bacterium]|jgi:glycolate oxidase|nr:alpha-hydroxy acid oxidase [Stellaceae bacterium]
MAEEPRRNSSGLQGKFETLHEFVKAARFKLAPTTWDYVVGAAETETTLKRNRYAIDSVAFRPRVLNDITGTDAAGLVMGKKARLPVMLAPVGGLERIDPEGAAAVARGATLFGVPQMLSSVSDPGLEATAKAANGRKFFQLYRRGPDSTTDEIVDRAVDAGYEAFCYTIDSAVYGRRERDIARRVSNRSLMNDGGDNRQQSLSWSEVKRFKDKHGAKLPLVLKGIQTGEDAAIACDHGVDAIYITNHGGRQLDHVRGTLDILPEVVEAVRGRAQIIIDGGFYRGTDVVKAIALGANTVAIGRIYLYGLAAAGGDGVARVLEILEHEIRTCLSLIGCNGFHEVTKSHVAAAPSVTMPHVFSAFPLLNLADEGYGGR